MIGRAWLLSILFVALLGGCKDPRKDMASQPKYRPQEPAMMFADGSSARPLVAGTVPRDPAQTPSRAWASGRNLTPAMSVDVAQTDSIPFAINADTLARGQQGFNIYCSVCHGRLGNGNGMIVQRGFPRPPSFHVDRLKQAPDSHFYNVISNGFGAMYGYSERVPPKLRWEIVAYIRALQAAPDYAPGGASAGERSELVAWGDRPASTIPSTRSSTMPTSMPKQPSSASRPAGGRP